ncbi:hypothetical protein JZ751_017409 [Albula glossodonta]|uniref:Apoptosis facilitator Bcl-2-like protein 14 n=1 Tax=Albula glossodonta TaxID=121402 RepID=A0A8T2PHM3_9TELE|nr:hypothetical protein JZ751_017409 [Albula glossodonta]
MQSVDRGTSPQPQVLSLGHNDATRLLEVYVTRSLSLNDGRAGDRQSGVKSRKWVTLADRKSRVRRYSSDSSVHLRPNEGEDMIGPFEPVPMENPSTTPVHVPADHPTDVPRGTPMASHLESSTEYEQDGKSSKKGAKKSKKPSFLKSILNIFSRKGGQKKEERKSSSPDRVGPLIPPDVSSSGANQASPQARRSLKRKLSRRFSFRNRGVDEVKNRSLRKPSSLDLSKKVHVAGAVSVEPTSLYYEKVSEELEKIVKEVKNSPTDEGQKIFDQGSESMTRVTAEEAEVMEKIINLIKQQGDAIEEELKLNEYNGISSFFQRLSYGSFRQLADFYVETGTPSQLPEGTVTAPELVKFAFTLDFTAKVAGLSSQTLGRIMGFGNQYLQDRFTQMSVAHMPESQPQAGQDSSDPD